MFFLFLSISFLFLRPNWERLLISHPSLCLFQLVRKTGEKFGFGFFFQLNSRSSGFSVSVSLVVLFAK